MREGLFKYYTDDYDMFKFLEVYFDFKLPLHQRVFLKILMTLEKVNNVYHKILNKMWILLLTYYKNPTTIYNVRWNENN